MGQSLVMIFRLYAFNNYKSRARGLLTGLTHGALPGRPGEDS